MNSMTPLIVLTEPAWLMAQADQQAALIKDAVTSSAELAKQIAPAALMITSLTEAPDNASAADFYKWDHSCDNCGKFVQGIGLVVAHVIREVLGQTLYINFAGCFECLSEATFRVGIP